jgi:predicted ATPase
MLLGRARECARVDGLLEHARAGTSGTLLVYGEPGIGKSALLGYASARAAGMRMLHATGAEFESELAFSGLHELVHPLAQQIDQLPGAQARAVRVALALDDGEPVERF